jgi:hypothetical protein
MDFVAAPEAELIHSSKVPPEFVLIRFRFVDLPA